MHLNVSRFFLCSFLCVFFFFYGCFLFCGYCCEGYIAEIKFATEVLIVYFFSFFCSRSRRNICKRMWRWDIFAYDQKEEDIFVDGCGDVKSLSIIKRCEMSIVQLCFGLEEIIQQKNVKESYN
ncbi:uncharacterized protein LOC131077062 isoform X2 [Cryptomeria japonica]|uniref:uncharacterized protein LOC131077062 isoform X2 n=1 Tax=Cryptomeria japonica TaxID=3369 RepID=UPI0025AD0268|nr:uncharacterized protein LOC131077062 isoform X2 [Cryptomeria japonica]